MDFRAGNADILVEFQTLLEPVVGELHAVFGAAEILDFHLLEFAGTEDVVARVDLIAEGFADLRDAKGELLARCVEHIAEIHKDRLRGLRAEINKVVLALKRTGVAFEHEVEVARLREVAASALRAVFFAVLLRQLVGAVAGVAHFAVDHRVAECLLVSRGLPDGAVHDDRAVHALHVVALAHIAAPPEVLEVFLQLDPERAVIPKAIQAAVDFGGLENEPAAFAKAHDFFHSGGRSFFGHKGGIKPDSRGGVNAAVGIAFFQRMEFCTSHILRRVLFGLSWSPCLS